MCLPVAVVRVAAQDIRHSYPSTQKMKTMLQCLAKPLERIWRIFKRKFMADEREMRLQRLHTLREKGVNPYPNQVVRTHTVADVLEHFDTWEGLDGSFTLTGRIRLLRDMGKSAFVNIE